MKNFTTSSLGALYKPDKNSSGEDNGQVTIVGGSSLFHGAPFFSIQAASRIVDMVFFASPERSPRDVAANLKSKIGSFIWVPFDEVKDYIKKSDAALIGPGIHARKDRKRKPRRPQLSRWKIKRANHQKSFDKVSRQKMCD